MVAKAEAHEHDTRLVANGLLPLAGTGVDGTEWMGHLEWGPGNMANDMGPATVVVTEEDLQREATAIVVQRAVERAIEKGEHGEYDE